MKSNELKINETLVRQLINTQFPQWKNLSISAVATSGWDNCSFRLGKDILVRVPSAAKYAVQVKKEQYWLPKLAPLLPLTIPEPLAMGEPSKVYPYHWSVYRWIEGKTAVFAKSLNLEKFAVDLASFLVALQNIKTTHAPLFGKHNFYRGGDLSIYDQEIKKALKLLKGKVNIQLVLDIWKSALKTKWDKPPVWIHGDVSAGNLLVYNGKLSAVIDFGMMGIGDPACDLVIAWTFLEGESREIFRQILKIDEATWLRGIAWALWKALIILSGVANSNSLEVKQSSSVLNEIVTAF